MGLSILISIIEPTANSYHCSQFGQAQGLGLKAPLGHLSALAALRSVPQAGSQFRYALLRFAVTHGHLAVVAMLQQRTS